MSYKVLTGNTALVDVAPHGDVVADVVLRVIDKGAGQAGHVSAGELAAAVHVAAAVRAHPVGGVVDKGAGGARDVGARGDDAALVGVAAAGRAHLVFGVADADTGGAGYVGAGELPAVVCVRHTQI